MPRFPVAARGAQFTRIAYTGDGQASKIVVCGFKPRVVNFCKANDRVVGFIVADEEAHCVVYDGIGTSWYQRTGTFLTDTGIDIAVLSTAFGCGLNDNLTAYILLAIG